jgi:hypothetical protein
MYFKNFKEPERIFSSIDNKGIAVLKNFLTKQKILEIKKKSIKSLDKVNLLVTPSNVKEISKIKKSIDVSWLPKKYKKKFLRNEFQQPTGEIEKKLDNEILKKGFKHYRKFTNSVAFKNPLINFPEINEIVFNENLIKTAKKFLKAEPFLGYVAVRCHFKNNLPAIDFNLFHTDSRVKITKSKDKVLKLTVPFHLTGKQKIEFNHILKKKTKMKADLFYKLQYSNFSELPKNLRKKTINPNVLNGDALFFDPENFFHNASKSDRFRIILYIVYIKKNNYMVPKTRKINIKKNYFKKLDNIQQNFAKFLNRV